MKGDPLVALEPEDENDQTAASRKLGEGVGAASAMKKNITTYRESNN